MGEGTDKQAGNWQGTGNSCMGMTPPPHVLCPDPSALCFQTLDINWTGMTNLLDIPGLRCQGLTEHLLSVPTLI